MQPAKRKRQSDGVMDHRKGSSSMSEKQRSLMLDFLSQNPSMIRDRSVGGTSNRPNRDELWDQLASILNTCGSGAQKDGCGWRRSWQDLKRYESLKAKESMTKLGKMSEKLQETATVSLSPLQEKIANLLNISIADVAECVDVTTSCDTQEKLSEHNQSTTPEFRSDDKHFKSKGMNPDSPQGDNTATEVNMAQALHSIATALTERNAIEERKLRVFENLLTVYAAKNGIGITDALNLDRGPS